MKLGVDMSVVQFVQTLYPRIENPDLIMELYIVNNHFRIQNIPLIVT